MKNNFYNKIFPVIILALFSFTVIAEENKSISEHQYNIFTGNFDFSDNKQKAILVGFQHQNENLDRDTFLGEISPITGGFITENSAAYIYTGIEWNYAIGDKFNFTPSFAPGIYHEGNGKDLGHALGCGGHVIGLRRLAAGPYVGSEAISFEQLDAYTDHESLDSLLKPIGSSVQDWPKVRMVTDTAHYLLQGQPVQLAKAPTEGWVQLLEIAEEGDVFLGVGEVLADGRIAPRRLVVFS